VSRLASSFGVSPMAAAVILESKARIIKLNQKFITLQATDGLRGSVRPEYHPN